MKAVILCGGGGTRLWPLSREDSPKQFHRLLGARSLLQETVARVMRITAPENIYISTNSQFVDEIRFQLAHIPQENIIEEPQKMDNAPAIGLTLAHLLRHSGPSEPVMYLPADHVFERDDRLITTLEKAVRFAEAYPDSLLTIGIRPTYPATTYGYIKMTSREIGEGAFAVERFVEKPTIEVATEYVASWEYLWNLGIFVSSLGGLYRMYEQHLPDTFTKLEEIRTADQEAVQEKIRTLYPQMEKTSIDFGIVEKLTDIAVLPADNLGWTDIGNFKELYNVQQGDKDEHQNILHGNVLPVDTKGSMIYGHDKKLIVTFGVEDLVIVDTHDALLIMPRERSADLKIAVGKMKEAHLDDYL